MKFAGVLKVLSRRILSGLLPFDFTPTAEALMTAATDGYPLGDLNWFGKDVVKAWEIGIRILCLSARVKQS